MANPEIALTKIGEDMANMMARKSIQVIDNFPSDDGQRIAIARALAKQLNDWADDIELRIKEDS